MVSKDVTPTDEFVKGLWRDNPVFVQVLGMCPALAVSNTAMNALAMGLATTFVLLAAGLSVSLLRNFIPREARIVSFICIIASFVTCVDYVIQAISLDLHRSLGAFISLIVVNCLILGRAEAFASKNGPGRAALDALGMIQQQPVQHTTAAIMASRQEALKPESLHDLDLVDRHGPLAVGLVA